MRINIILAGENSTRTVRVSDMQYLLDMSNYGDIIETGERITFGDTAYAVSDIVLYQNKHGEPGIDIHAVSIAP